MEWSAHTEQLKKKMLNTVEDDTRRCGYSDHVMSGVMSLMMAANYSVFPLVMCGENTGSLFQYHSHQTVGWGHSGRGNQTGGVGLTWWSLLTQQQCSWCP